MAIRRGSSTPSAIYRGATAVQKVMRGTVQVWSASIYPQSGTWGPTSLSGSYTTRASHTIAEAGSYTITHSVNAAGINTSARISGPWGTTTGDVVNLGGTSTATTTQTLSPGAVINFQAVAISGSSHTGSWSIVKN